MKKLTILLILPLFVCCHPENDTFICSGVDIKFLNQSGEDIFDSATSNHLELSDIKVYAADSVDRLNFIGKDADNKHVFNLWVYGEGVSSLEGATFIKLGNITTDTLSAKFSKGNSSIYIKELYYNGILIENNANASECGDLEVHEIQVVLPEI
jgi:hypothetical protein